jgi:hypothetical protein
VITQIVADALVTIELFVRENWAFVLVVLVALPWKVAGRRSRVAGFVPRDSISLSIVVGVALLWVVGGALVHGVPRPQVADDFSYLLAADMYAHGHLSYPTHPLWQHFETLHVLPTPRYASQYQPAQGLALAAGILLFGVPLAGVWITVALAAAATWWALRVWTTPTLALLGGLAVATHRTMLIWGEVYHGGAIAAAAGAVMLAAAGKMIESPSRREFAIIATGAVVLAFSRPYEGLVYSIAVGVVLLIAVRWRDLIRMSPIAIAILIAGAAGILGFNHTITGNAFLLPHALHDERYIPAPNFVWEAPKPFPHYDNLEAETTFRIGYWDFYKHEHEPGGMRAEIGKKFAVMGWAITGAPANDIASSAWLLMFVPLVALIPLLRENKKARLLFVALLIFAFAPLSINWWMQLHYLAPGTALALTLVAMLLARFWTMRRGMFLTCVIVALFATGSIASWVRFVQTPDGGFEPRRQQIAHELLALGGKHLVIVATDVFGAIYNAGDIDAAPIVWARDRGDNRALIAYFHDRMLWRLERDHGAVLVHPERQRGINGGTANNSTSTLRLR